MRVAVCDYQGKSSYLVAQFAAAGVEIASRVADADVLLCDAPGLRGPGNVPEVLEAQRFGIPIVGYPHGGNPMLWPFYVDHPCTSVELVAGPGQARIFEEHGIRYRVVGWLYSERRQFQPPPYDPLILFCPQHHPSAIEQAANEHARAQLSGRNVRLHDGATVGEATAAIDQADVVIANDTVLALAIALGKPAIAILSDRFSGVDGHDCPWDESYVYPISLDKVSLDAALDLCRDEALIAGWRDLWVGGPLDVEATTACLSEHA